MDSVKAVLRGRFIVIQAYLKKQEKSQINNLTLHLKKLEKEEMKKERNLKNQGSNKCRRNKRNHSKNQQSRKLVL